MRRLLDRAVRWFVNNVGQGTTVAEDIELFKPLMDPLRTHLVDYVRGSDRQRVEEWFARAEQWGLPDDIARHWAEQFESFGLLDIALIARQIDEPVDRIAQVYYAVYDRFAVDNLLERITTLPRMDRWQALARAALRDDLYSTIADMTVSVMKSSSSLELSEAGERLDTWEQQNAEMLERARHMFVEVNRLERDDMASLSVALRLLRSIVRR